MTLLHRRCESLEATLRARISDLEADRDRDREAAHERETELFNRLLAVTNPGALAAAVAANRSDRPASGLPGVPIRKQPFPSTSPFTRELMKGSGNSPLLRPSEPPPTPASTTDIAKTS